MKKITKFLINLISVGSIVLIATLDASQLAVVGLPTPSTDGKPGTESGGPRFGPPTPSTDGKPFTESGGPRLVQPIEDMLPGDLRRVTRKASKCVKGEIEFTALIPENKIGRTVSEYPVFFFYLPQTEAELAEFVLKDENGNPIYQTTLKTNNSSGVIGVSLPANKNVSPLQVGKNYRWSVALICEAQDRSADILEQGIVRRVELSEDIRSQLEKADARQKTFIYAENGIWQEALSNLAAARRANPNDAELTADWESLLDSVKLGKIAKEPIVEIEPQP
ncbi:protein of unknown function DUF928 [Oscillatoria nigro-viridis PCC 7112]|uniref:DUF928 domain-containing protein n=1 Tax=Phormidium nigroviride PCC 7112 TaxID=179408 RepID=K9VI77_9CYAN|nr:DUF928 domain-containing protein [Oscillatoria nigro-viridis]AFZ07808.1 protein of unknown function DUF928 [Oscillatoria nigro-viridis PCC 7112]